LTSPHDKLGAYGGLQRQALDENQSKEDAKRFAARFADQEFDHKEKDHQTKVVYTQEIYKLMVWYVSGVFLFLVVEALLMAWHHPTLDSSVLIALAVTSTANIIGLFAIVTHHYFPKR
jgi:peptidoglycan biosynthesis protein MviN/MurJ (putative lipid II flippase)